MSARQDGVLARARLSQNRRAHERHHHFLQFLTVALGKVSAVDKRPSEVDFRSRDDVARSVLLHRGLVDRLFAVVTDLAVGFGLIRCSAALAQGVLGSEDSLLQGAVCPRILHDRLRCGAGIRIAVGVASNQIRIATHNLI